MEFTQGGLAGLGEFLRRIGIGPITSEVKIRILFSFLKAANNKGEFLPGKRTLRDIQEIVVKAPGITEEDVRLAVSELINIRLICIRKKYELTVDGQATVRSLYDLGSVTSDVSETF